jgi:hypothetical protein
VGVRVGRSFDVVVDVLDVVIGCLKLKDLGYGYVAFKRMLLRVIEHKTLSLH